MTDAREEMIVNDYPSVADPGTFVRRGMGGLLVQTFRKNDQKKGKRGKGGDFSIDSALAWSNSNFSY